ncbi:MAG: methylornithine synthase PylB [Methanomassiliicoccales archaeon]|nr:methylornithine synthase PylB [Methanomassiliicoccales archaeon]TFG55344.1 MAG: methylornithine synthase PylB [Methanomassiliicoccus sp.]
MNNVVKHRPGDLDNMSFDLENILGKAVDGSRPTFTETVFLLGLRDPSDLERLYNVANDIRHKHFSNDIFLYGFVYYSTYCRNRCSFCFYNHENDLSPRYRKTTDEIIALSEQLQEGGVNLIDLTMGEDPYYHGAHGWRRLVQLISDVNDHVELPLMVSPGVLPDMVLKELAVVGADWYACYQETHNRQLFKSLRPGQDFDIRMGQRLSAARYGMLVEDGMMLDVGESQWDRAYAIHQMCAHKMHQIRAMTFVPQAGTPMSSMTSSGVEDELKTIAVMRLVCQDRLIPASLDIDGSMGLKRRIDAGANVVTSIIPPDKGLAGVAQHELDIDNGGRTVASVSRILDSMGLRRGPQTHYDQFIEMHRSVKEMG